MTNGGLLERAVDQQNQTNLSLEAEIADSPDPDDGGPGILEALKAVLLFGLIPIILFRGFDTVLFIFTGFGIQVLSPIVYILSFGAIIWRIGLISPSGLNLSGASAGVTSVIAGFFALILVSQFVLGAILGAVLEGELTVGEVEFSEDGESLSVKLRQNTISDKDVGVSIKVLYSGDLVLSENIEVSIDKSDGLGDYGEFTIPVSQFYSGNALPNSPYSIEITVDGQVFSRDLASSLVQWPGVQWNGAEVLSRDITTFGGDSLGVVKNDPDRCSGDSENCLVGVIISGWAGLDVGSESPARAPFANFTFDAVLMEGNDIAVSYPSISVVNSQASWDSNGGEFGTGSAPWGLEGTEFPLEGSILDPNYGKYIPRDEFDSAGDYGCYTLTVTIEQIGHAPQTQSSYYEYSSSNSNDIWSSVSSC